MMMMDVDATTAAPTWQYHNFEVNGDKVEQTVTMYSEEERILLINKVNSELSKKIGNDGGFTYYTYEDANFDDAELTSISDAVFHYFDERIYKKWAQTGAT
jgi:hypothetical protein